MSFIFKFYSNPVSIVLVAAMVVAAVVAHPHSHPNWKPDLTLAVSAEKRDTSNNVTRLNHMYWKNLGRAHVLRRLKRLNGRAERRPKNVVVFLGDGMGLTMIKAARIYRARKLGLDHNDEHFSFEDFDFSGLSHTAAIDRHVTDSAAGAMAVMGGLKVDQDQLGKNPGNDLTCSKGVDAEFRETIADLALIKGMNVGFVTTTAITDATPGSLYAKGVHRNMEWNGKTTGTQCKDIASQTLEYPANQFKVMLGGGNDFFVTEAEGGNRTDGRNIHNEWKNGSDKNVVLKTLADFQNFQKNFTNADKVLGTFNGVELRPVYLQQHDNKTTMPALKDMVEVAIKMLRKDNEHGFVLLVEGGQIDYGEHDNNMHYACEEMLAFDDAIQKVIESLGTDAEDTLFVTTADHSHAFSVTQNDVRPDESIFTGGMHSYYKSSGIEMATVMFVSGPGNRNGTWHRNYTDAETAAFDYVQPASIDAAYGAHGGEDVGVWAKGPYSWLFSGSMENTQIAYNIKYALCLDPTEPSVCDPLNIPPRF